MKAVSRLWCLTVLATLSCLALSASGFDAFITIQDGYFHDPAASEPWLPHGVAYQTWNRPLGVWQTHEQIDYDLDEMVKMGANSVRIDMVWQRIEAEGDNIFDWEDYDYFISACEQRGLRIFALIGYQWPPDWFPDEWYTMHPPEYDSEGIYHPERWQSDIINFEHPDARAEYAEWINAVCARYKDSKAIVGWIVGNEYGYLGLWSGLLDGYDPQSEQAFRTWLAAKYGTIASANVAWGGSFTNFNEVTFPDQYRAYGLEGAVWADAVQWREDSIAEFTALSAESAKNADPNHLISYSTVGMQWGEEDWRYHAEDRGKITAAAAALGADIDFFSVNNYPWSVLGHESQNGQWGVSYTKKVAGVPVLYTETGFTSSETMWPDMNEFRQGPLVRNSLWEGLQAGAIGTHIFTWQDRPWITDREKGFGVVYADRNIKPAFWTCRNTYNLMKQVEIGDLLAGSTDPEPDIAFLWTAANDSQYNRYECEMQQIAGGLERLGYEPNFMDLNDLAAGAYTNFKAVILPRNMRVEDRVPGHTNSVLNFLLTKVIPKGVHVLASADLPGMQDFNGKPRPEALSELQALFGIDASNPGGYEMPQRRRHYVSDYWELIEVDFNSNAVGSVAGNYHCWPIVWKYSDQVKVTDGTAWATMDTLRNRGFEDSNTSIVRWDGSWGNAYVRSGWGWAFEGNNMVQMWGDAGMWKDFPVVPFGRYTHSAYLRSNSDDPLHDGTEAWLSIEWYDEEGELLSTSESTHLATNTPGNSWVQYAVDATAPSNAWTGRRITRVMGPGGGSVYVDDNSLSPAVVVKDHGAAKAAIFLYSVGDTKPDGDLDGFPDAYAWRWRYDVLGGVVRDYFGVQPSLQVAGANAYLCLADYRTLADGSTLWQVKNYMYDPDFPASWEDPIGGGPDQTFTISSALFAGKTIRALEQARILETNSDGTVSLTLVPDGMEILHVYPEKTNDMVLKIADAPAVIRPFGDKNFVLTVQYDTAGLGDLTFKVALMTVVGGSNQVVEVIEFAASGAGTTNLYMYIPDPDLTDPSILSTAEGGEWLFAMWAEDEGERVTDVLTQGTELAWGIKPQDPLPTSLSKGDTVNAPVIWQNLYEQLPWQNTPMTRADGFPSRVALFRSTKTEAAYPGQFARANAVADWLESMGYEAANPLDISFDNVTVAVSEGAGPGGLPPAFADDMESGTGEWTADGLWHLAADLSFSPSHAWAYNNGANYSTGVRNSGSLTTPWICLTNATGATLSFRSWYETEDTGTSWDKKLVQVTTDGTNWTQVLQVSGLNRQWVPQTVDLGAYAGKNVRVRFFFDTMDAVYNQFRGWYVDDVEVLQSAEPAVEVFFDDMETATNWAGSGLWRWATNRAAGGAHSYVYNNGVNYSTGVRNSGGLVSDWIDLSDVSGAKLSFQSWYLTEDTGTSWDRKLVQVSTDGTNWTQVKQVSGAAGQWTGQTADLAAYAGKQIRLRFFFDTIDAIANQYEGWYVDDVRITAVGGGSGGAVFSDAVEGGANGWSAGALWHIAEDLSASPTHSWAYNDGTDYDTGVRNSGELISPWIDLRPAASATLQFQSWYETEDAGTSWDRKLVYVSTDGTNWTQVHQVSGPMRQWIQQAADVSAFAGSRVRVKFVFDTMDAVYNNFKGWYVDDIRVQMVGSGLLFFDGFDVAELPGWTRVAGAANWTVDGGALRAARIGNSDNIMAAGAEDWADCTVSADIRYNTQDKYFNDAELYVRYQDRDNFIKVGIRNSYGFWRLKYTVRAATNIVDQGWLYEFAKTNSPAEDTWYNLSVLCTGDQFSVSFNGAEVGSFTATNFPAGRVAVGTMASQLGTWEPQKGYFFVDDDEYSFWAPEGESQLGGHPLNLDWGYLNQFFGTLILPGTYVMSDLEVSNVITYLNSGLFSVIATDGGVAMEDETGASGLGRIEGLFGVSPDVLEMGALSGLTIGTNLHYVTLDHAADAVLPASGAAAAWMMPTAGRALGWVYDGVDIVPALIANVITNDPLSPKKVFCFNFGVEAADQMSGSLSNIAKRAFEWARGQAYRVRAVLKYEVHPEAPAYDITVREWDAWILSGSGSNTLVLDIPEDGIMTGSNMYWVIYTYPWDAGEPWAEHAGFYTSQNDGGGQYVSIGGIGLQIFGGTDKAFGGRLWDLWMGYNTLGEPMTLTFGLKEKGDVLDEDNFDDGVADGWTVQPEPNYLWSVTNGALRYTSPAGGSIVHSWLMRDGLDVSNNNITIEYNVKYGGAAEEGGLIYRGQVLNLHPWGVYWSTNSPLDLSSGSASNFSGLVTNADGSVSYVITGTVTIHIGPPYFTADEWHHVVVNIRDGDPYPVSDVLIDGQEVLFMEPLKHTNWTGNSVALLSPGRYGYVEWDNFRVADEHYSFVTEEVNGVYVPTSAVTPFYAFVPDYDPDYWEYEGTSLGGQYEWFAYLRGKDAHDARNVGVYFSPRLATEDPSFPTAMNAGDLVYVPVEWEELPEVPARLHLELVDPYSGAVAVNENYTISQKSGSLYLSASVLPNAQTSPNYLWAAYVCPTNSADPYGARVGLDDTYRFNRLGEPVEPEVQVSVAGVESESDELTLYSDAGLLAGLSVYTWYGGTAVFDGDSTSVVPPEGVKSFRTSGSSWAGWGLFVLDGGLESSRDMREYTNGFLRFWYRSPVNLKLEVKDAHGTARYTTLFGTTNTWKEMMVPISSFGGVDLSQMFGLFSITAQTAAEFYVDHVRWVKGIYRVYRDAGIPEGMYIPTWTGGWASFDGEYVDSMAPEGVTVFRTESDSWAGWGVASSNGAVDLRLYSNGYVCFWARSATALKIEVEGPGGTKGTTYIGSTGGGWQEFGIPVGEFSGVDLSQVSAPFLVTAETGTTFYIDNVRWVRGTNIVLSSPKVVVYSDAGIPPGCDVYVWWASQYWAHVSSAAFDGGFEESTPGAFPDSGYWFLSGTGSAGAVCSAAAARSGSAGLRSTSASQSWAPEHSVYQELTAYAGDIYRAWAYVRQPGGASWIPGSEAFVRLSFLDAWHQELSFTNSATKVTSAGQDWTLCSIPDTTAPFGTRYVRYELVVNKPGGQSGTSVADFDDCRLDQGNSFNGEFAEDPAPPEGGKTFRSYCVNWSGWGIFYTNTTVDLSTYSNGYLKFWLKSSGYTKIEIQSEIGGTNTTRTGAYYNPTTNEVGDIIWHHKVIPITNFTGVALTNIKSPFMATDPTYDRSYSIDYVRWEMNP
ncbi:MAG: beta-galactosidase [Kiritimatiellae bacterium]|nr:beta-galactosidase [Kiritimatiellia bacterium]